MQHWKQIWITITVAEENRSPHHSTLYRLPPVSQKFTGPAQSLVASGMGDEGSGVGLEDHRAYQAPHPENPIACRTVRMNCAPKMKKKAIKLNELSDLQRKRGS